MRTSRSLKSLAFTFGLLASPMLWAQEEDVALTDVPEVVLAAAIAAVEGLQITEAEVEIEDGVTVYELEGNVGDVEYEIELTADGEVLEVEADD